MPESAWIEVATDFHGPLSNGDYLMVIVDEFSRFPIVKIIKSTGAEDVIPILKETFNLFGIPKSLKTDNGPPFQGHKLAKFLESEGVKHREITKIAPAKLFLKTERSSSRLPNYGKTNKTQEVDWVEKTAFNNDAEAKRKMKVNMDKKLKVCSTSLQIGDKVLLSSQVSGFTRKAYPRFDPLPFVVINMKGSIVTVRRGGKVVTRNSSFFRKFIENKPELEPILVIDPKEVNNDRTEAMVQMEGQILREQAPPVTDDNQVIDQPIVYPLSENMSGDQQLRERVGETVAVASESSEARYG